MRRRARSLHIETAPRPDEDAEENQWSPGENLKLLRMVYQQLPLNDSIPFNERLENINWKRISTEERSEKEVQNQFDYLLSKTRNFRILSEILDDLEKVITDELPLPKKQNAFSLFMEENKEDIKREIGRGNKKGAFVTVAAERFKELSDKEREKYVTRAKLIKQTHDDYFINNNIEKRTKKKLAKPSKKTKAEQANSPVIVFWKHKKKKDATVTLKSARKMYAALERKKKIKYIFEFLDINEGEKLNMEQYENAEKSLSKDELAIVEEYEGRPKRLSAYNFFMKDRLGHKSDTSMNASYNFKTVAEEWKNLNKDEKAKYEEKSKHTHENYVHEYIEYIKSLPLDRQPFEMNRILSKELHKKFPNKKRKISTKEDSQGEEVLAVIDVNKEKNKTRKQAKIQAAKSEFENVIPSFIQAPESSPKKKVKLNIPQDLVMTTIPRNAIKEEIDPDQVPDVHKKKFRKTSDSVSETDTDQQINESSSSIILPSQQVKTLQSKFPSSVFKYYAQMIFDGPKEKAKRAFKRLNFEEKEELNKKYGKAKKKFLKSDEGKFKSPPPFNSTKLSKNSFSQSEISNDEISLPNDSD